MSSNLNVTVSLDPIWERFDAVDANAAILTDRIKRLEERARAEDDGTREALAMATERVQELERQLKAHHEHEASTQAQLEVIARALASVELGNPSSDLGQRVRTAIDTLVHRAHALQGELQGMHHRERQVEQVVEAWDVERGGLKGYDKLGGVLDPESPAGRVVELLRDLTKVRPMTTAVLESRGAALNAIESNLGKYGLGRGEGDYPDIIVEAVSVALRDRADALQQLRTIDNALTMHADKRDPLTMALKHPADTAARVAEALSAALKVADDITKAADDAEREQREYNNPFPEPADIAGSDGYVAGLRAAAHIAAGETPEADPNVAHIDTVNGRGAHAQRADERPVGVQVRHPDPLTDPEENG